MQNLKFTPFPVLTTARVQLRKLTEQDTAAIQELRSNEQVNTYLSRSGPISHEQARAFIDTILNNIDKDESVYWAITLQNSRQLIGTICLWNFNPLKKMADIGYELHPDYQGKGLMQEALQAVLQYGFTTLQLETITALCAAGNTKSIQLLIKNHFLPDIQHEYVTPEEAEGLAVYYLQPAIN